MTLNVLSRMYQQQQGIIIGQGSGPGVFISPYKDCYTRDTDPSKFAEYNKSLVIAKNTLTVRVNQNEYIRFYREMLDDRILDSKVYNAVVKQQTDAFYYACEASYYYTYYSSGDIEFSDFESRYIQCVNLERDSQKNAFFGILDDLYYSENDYNNKEIYHNPSNSIYVGLRSKIVNAKFKADIDSLVQYFTDNFAK